MNGQSRRDVGDVLRDFAAWAKLAVGLEELDSAQQQQQLDEYELAAIWPRADSAWRRIMDEEIEAGKLDRAKLYASLCAERYQKQKAQRPAPQLGRSAADELNVTTDFRQQLIKPEPSQAQPAAPSGKGQTLVLDDQPPAPEPPAVAPKGVKPTPERPARLDQPAKSEAPDFVASLAPKNIVQPPLADQQATASGPIAGVKDLIRMTQEAIQWPVETYAYVCARVAADPKQAAAVWKEHGITDDSSRKIVERKWQQRLAADPNLHRQWSELMERFQSGGSPTSRQAGPKWG